MAPTGASGSPPTGAPPRTSWPPWLLLIPLSLFLAWFARWYRRDLERVRGRRTVLVNMSVASRARRLKDCPPAFLARLQAVLDARDGDQP